MIWVHRPQYLRVMNPDHGTGQNAGGGTRDL
jgi:hypothetical protein